MGKKYATCYECGTIHYIVNKKEAAAIMVRGHPTEEFSIRNLSNCFRCGSKSKFSMVTDDYVDEYGSGDHIQPILLDDGELESATDKH